MIGAALQGFAMVLALVGGLGELLIDSGVLLQTLVLPVGAAGFALEAYEFHVSDAD